jgi:hypothetical protein
MVAFLGMGNFWEAGNKVFGEEHLHLPFCVPVRSKSVRQDMPYKYTDFDRANQSG